jgi:hypothetical protein
MSLVNRRSPEITTWDLPAMMSLSVDIGLRSGQKHVEPLPRCQCRVQDLMMCGTYDETADQEQNPIDATERQNRPPVCARRRANDVIRRQPYTAPIPAPVIVVPGRFTRVVACQVDEQAKHDNPHEEAYRPCQSEDPSRVAFGDSQDEVERPCHEDVLQRRHQGQREDDAERCHDLCVD